LVCTFSYDFLGSASIWDIHACICISVGSPGSLLAYAFSYDFLDWSHQIFTWLD
jgi:hypothetical protein